MMPDHVALTGSPWPVLPPGIHEATLSEIEARFATNPIRRGIFRGLVAALELLRGAGCKRVFIDGSFVTAKPNPGDFDACWDPSGINFRSLDPIFLNFDDDRAAQKAKFKGELFPSTVPADAAGTVFVKFFQTDRFTGAPKGIVSVDLTKHPALNIPVTS